MTNTKQTKQELNQIEMDLLIKCNKILNGFSKAFRDLWAEKIQEDRIKFMQDLVDEHEELSQ